ncbi:GHKL domain-containing protein [Blautia aquisgranensis]|uniref:GHKL domain-containing protein n=1 Tax=Blautia aquisgranensis TaxID=3133153 RepID=UPI003F49A764
MPCFQFPRPVYPDYSKADRQFPYDPYAQQQESAQKFNRKTSKANSWSHGFGLAIIEEIASRYDGSCQWLDKGVFLHSYFLCT